MSAFMRGAPVRYKGKDIVVHTDGHDIGHKRAVIAIVLPGSRPPLPDAVLGVGETDEEAAQDALSKARALIDR